MRATLQLCGRRVSRARLTRLRASEFLGAREISARMEIRAWRTPLAVGLLAVVVRVRVLALDAHVVALAPAPRVRVRNRGVRVVAESAPKRDERLGESPSVENLQTVPVHHEL